MAKDFWQKPWRIVQPNMRKIDAVNLDAGSLMERTAEYGANVTQISAAGIVAWYPTKLPYQPVNEFLKGDFIGEVIEEAHRRDIKVLLRVDISKQYDHQYEKHPDWFMHDADGQPVREWEMLATCLHGPYVQECNFEILEELLDRYEPDGFFYNSYRYRDCYCERCRAAFKKASGHDLPARENWDDPAWKAYVNFRYRAIEQYSQRLQDYVHSRKPDAVVSLPIFITFDEPERLCRSGWSAKTMLLVDVLSTEAFNALGRPFPKWIYLAGEEARISRSMEKPTKIGLTYSEVFASRRSGQPAAQYTYDIMQAAAHGGNPNAALSGTFEQDDRKALPAIKKTFNFLKSNVGLYDGARSVAKTMLYYSQKTMDFYGRGNSRERALFEYRGFYEALVHSHLQFDVFHDGTLDEKKLSRYGTVVLANVACLDRQEQRLFDDFVSKGGNLIASHETSLYDEQGEKRDGFGLDCMAYTIDGSRNMVGSYLVIHHRETLKSFHDVDLIALNGELLRVEPADPNTVLLKDLAATPIVKNNTPEFAYWSGSTEEHGLYVTRYEQGRVAYLPWSVGKLYHTQGVPEYRHLIADLIDYLNGEREVLTDAPSSVEVSLTEGEAGLVVHLLNATGSISKPLTEVTPIHNIHIKIRTTGNRVRSLVRKEELQGSRSAAYLGFLIPRLDTYDVLVIR